MNLPLFIAWRYLFARKSHNVINVLSAISAVGMAIGTAALILILSVYNGFNRIVDENLSDFDPDVRLCAADGSYNLPDSLAAMFGKDPEVAGVCSVLEFEAFASYGDNRGAARILGTDGDLSLRRGDLKLATVGAGLARSMGINPSFLDPLKIYSPDRVKPFSPANPMASLHLVEVYPEHLISVNAEVDESTVIVPLETAQELFGIGGACSSVDIRLEDSSDRAVRHFVERYGFLEEQGFVLKDKYALHPELYRMMKMEKMAVYLILLFVVLIVALNVFSSLSMLMMEKRGDIGTLQSLGADETVVRRVFVYEGWLISLLGMLAGLVLGVAATLVQQHFGIVRMPGNYLVDAYPVALEFRDVLLSLAGVGLIGFLVAFFSYICNRDN